VQSFLFLLQDPLSGVQSPLIAVQKHLIFVQSLLFTLQRPVTGLQKGIPLCNEKCRPVQGKSAVRAKGLLALQLPSLLGFSNFF
jgi:hypothetical protein